MDLDLRAGSQYKQEHIYNLLCLHQLALVHLSVSPERCIHSAGINGGHTDIFASYLQKQTLGQHIDRGLGCTVQGCIGIGSPCRHAADIDDDSGFCGICRKMLAQMVLVRS